jgi:hypothetical protein
VANKSIQLGNGGFGTFIWEVPGAQPITVEVVTAVFDGTLAAAPFQPTLDIYSSGGYLVGRVFAQQLIQPGDVAEVTFLPFLGGLGGGSVTVTPSPVATSPQVFPILAGESGSYYGANWTTVRVDNTVRSNAVRTNQSGLHTAAVNDYFSCKCTLGPKGSIWGVNVAYKLQSTGGQFKVAFGSVESPNPVRVAADPNLFNGGTLDENPPSWVEFGDVFDTYAAVASDFSPGCCSAVFRIMGDDGAPFTTITPGGDAYTGFNTIDGGAGVYALRVRCSGKRAAATAYRCELTQLALMRLDDVGNY